MGGRRLLAEMLASPAPLAPSAPSAPSAPPVKTPCGSSAAAAATNATSTAVALSAAAEAATKNGQDQQVALLALVIVVALFAFLGAFAYMMISKKPSNEDPQEQTGDAPTIGGSVRGLQNFLFSRSSTANVGLDPLLIKCLPQQVYSSQEGSLRRRMPLSLSIKDGVAIGVPVDPAAAPLTPRVEGTADADQETGSSEPSLQPTLTPVGSHEELPAGNDQLPGAGEASADAGCSGPVGPTESSRKTGCYLRECPVCLGEYKDGDIIKWLPDCQHPFHGACIDMWLRSHSTCPVCRVAVGPALVRLGARPAA